MEKLPQEILARYYHCQFVVGSYKYCLLYLSSVTYNTGAQYRDNNLIKNRHYCLYIEAINYVGWGLCLNANKNDHR